MDMIPVSSSIISAIGWDNGIMHIKFTSGNLYEYSGVSASTYNALLLAPSHGKFFVECIKHKYVYREIN